MSTMTRKELLEAVHRLLASLSIDQLQDIYNMLLHMVK